MTQDRIIELARESQKEKLTAAGGHWFQMEVNDLERFAALVRAETLEKCAVVAWNHYMNRCKLSGISPTVIEDWCSAAAIRAMKEKT